MLQTGIDDLNAIKARQRCFFFQFQLIMSI
jgi:hypothetical protein